MRITLKNFRCHRHRIFEIPDEGFIAISGPSGAGKSTLLSAIVYCFFGKIPGKIRKPYTHGATTSKVEIEYQPVGTVTRTSRPNALLVITPDGVEHHDDEAQNIIDVALGTNYDEFLAASYIIQRSTASVLALSPAEATRFVETLANANAGAIKDQIKTLIREVNTERVGVQGELTALFSHLETLRIGVEAVVETPKAILDGADPDRIREEIASFRDRIAEITDRIAGLDTRLRQARLAERKISENSKRREALEAEAKMLRSTLLEIPLPETDELDAKIASLREELDRARRRKNYLLDLKKVDAAEAEFYASMEKKRATLEREVTELGDLETLEAASKTAAATHHNWVAASKVYAQGQERMEEIENELAVIWVTLAKAGFRPSTRAITSRIRAASKFLSTCIPKLTCSGCRGDLAVECPGCRTELSPVDFDVNRLVQKLREFETELKRLAEDPGREPEDPALSLKKYIRACRVTEEYAATINPTLPQTIQNMRSRLLARPPPKGRSESEISEELEKAIGERSKLDAVIENRTSVESSLRERETQLNAMTTIAPPKTPSATLEKMVSTATQKLVDANLEISNRHQILSGLAEYEEYLKRVADFEALGDLITETESRLEGISRRQEGLLGLAEVAREAEILALEETVRSINEHARFYLDQFFEEPISVRLECVKDRTGKLAKLQLNTTVDYKGSTYDDIDELSGGERQRCDAAFVLGVNDMIGSKILMLDECLNNLNDEINMEVLSLVRDSALSRGKMILVISHEAVTGLFDHSVGV